MQQEHFGLRGLCEHTEKDWKKCTREANGLFFQNSPFQWCGLKKKERGPKLGKTSAPEA